MIMLGISNLVVGDKVLDISTNKIYYFGIDPMTDEKCLWRRGNYFPLAFFNLKKLIKIIEESNCG